MSDSTFKCVLCEGTFEGFGNNPYPLCDREDYDSRCCDECDWSEVIPARMQVHQLGDQIQESIQETIQENGVDTRVAIAALHGAINGLRYPDGMTLEDAMKKVEYAEREVESVKMGMG